ncbi:MAG: hypothetical protein ABI824_15935 [Acidobacteriota bacterium]
MKTFSREHVALARAAVLVRSRLREMATDPTLQASHARQFGELATVLGNALKARRARQEGK